MKIHTNPSSETNHYTLIYLLSLLVAGGLFWAIFQLAPMLESGRVLQEQLRDNPASPLAAFLESFHHPLAHFFIQLLVILVASRVCGALAQRVGQPAVMGQTAAGILLGPSFLGLFWPETLQYLFPVDALQPLQLLSQFGLILFMFVIGLELELSYLHNRTHAAVMISHMSIIVPYVLGVGLATLLYQAYAPESISFLSFALFMGIAMSVTAFPVLAHILKERQITQTSFGTMALTCAAIDDVTAWCLLAAVVAIVKSSSLTGVLLTLMLSVIFVLLMLKGLRPLLATGLQRYRPSTSQQLAVALFVVLLSALCTEVLGIHALFGAFLAGVIMPFDAAFRATLRNKIEDFSLVILLPLFFAFTGLRTQIALLNQPALWGVCALIIFLAVAGKYGGTFIAARITGHSWGDASRLGILMNTRGLMELVVLNIGYDLGILSPEIFTAMVLMALVTTLMTGPGLALVDRYFPSTQS